MEFFQNTIKKLFEGVLLQIVNIERNANYRLSKSPLHFCILLRNFLQPIIYLQGIQPSLWSEKGCNHFF